MSSTDNLVDPLLEGYYEITLSYALHDFWNFLKSTLTKQAMLVARYLSLSANIEAAILIKVKVGQISWLFQNHRLFSALTTIWRAYSQLQEGLATWGQNIGRISARGHLYVGLEEILCLLTWSYLNGTASFFRTLQFPYFPHYIKQVYIIFFARAIF
jgi:hypothetical protein